MARVETRVARIAEALLRTSMAQELLEMLIRFISPNSDCISGSANPSRGAMKPAEQGWPPHGQKSRRAVARETIGRSARSSSRCPHSSPTAASLSTPKPQPIWKQPHPRSPSSTAATPMTCRHWARYCSVPNQWIEQIQANVDDYARAHHRATLRIPALESTGRAAALPPRPARRALDPSHRCTAHIRRMPACSGLH